jgi:hypothetical protein
MTTYTSRWPVTIDGVRLDTMAYNISTRQGRDISPAVQGANVDSFGRHGNLWSAHKKYGPGRMVLNMWVAGTDEDGVAPVDDYAAYRYNLDKLLLMLNVRHRQLDVRQTIETTGPIVRQALCEVTAVIDPSMKAMAPYTAEMTVEFTIPGAFWFDVADTNYDSGAAYVAGTIKTLTELLGSTAPMVDMYLVVDGPANSPKVYDNRSGHWVQYNGNLPSGQQWCVNTATWSSKVGVGIAFTDTGTDVYSSTTFAGGHSPKLFGLVADPAGPQMRMEGTGFGANTKFRIRTKRAYL